MTFFRLFTKSVSVGFVSHSLLYTFSFVFCDDRSQINNNNNNNSPLTISETFRSYFFSSSNNSNNNNNNNSSSSTNTIKYSNNNNNNNNNNSYDDCTLDHHDYNIWDSDWDRASLEYLQKQVDFLNNNNNNNQSSEENKIANNHTNYKIQKCKKKQIILVRHGQYENEGSSTQDSNKIKKLTLLGEQQAKLTGVYLKTLLESKKIALEKEKDYLRCRMKVKVLRDELIELKEEYKLERDNNNRSLQQQNNINIVNNNNINLNNNNVNENDLETLFNRKNDQIHQTILQTIQSKLKKVEDALETEKKEMIRKDIARRSTGGGDSFIIAPYINKIITSDLIRAKQTALGIIESVHPFIMEDENSSSSNHRSASLASFFSFSKNNNKFNKNKKKNIESENDNALFDDGDDTLNDDTELDELEDKRRQKENVILFASKYFPQFIFKMDPLLNENFPCDPIPYHGVTSLYTLQQQVDTINNNNNNFNYNNKKIPDLAHKARKKDSATMEEAYKKYFHRYTVVEDTILKNKSNKNNNNSENTNNLQVEVIVCHANVIRYFLLKALQLPPQAWLRLSLAHGSVTSLVLHEDGHVSVSAVGSHSHLPPQLLTSRNLI